MKLLSGHFLAAGSLASIALPVTEGQAEPMANAAKKTTQPPIILIMTDQQTASAMSCAGNPHVATPAMDALAEDGVQFTRAYCAYPLSGPSRAAMITGRMPYEIGVYDNGMRPHEEDMQQGLGHRLSEAGYECLYAGKWHIPEINIPEEGTGFRKISNLDDPGLADACDRALKGYDGKKPLLLYASFLDPHEICELGRFETLRYGALPEHKTSDCPNLPENFMPSTYEPEAIRLEQHLSPRYHNTGTYSQDDWRHYIYGYYRLVERVDKQVGRLCDVLKKHGLYDDAVIFFVSDHGDGVAAHQWNQKWSLYENCINVPLLMKAPKGQGLCGVKNEEALTNTGLDIYATMCDYAGVELDKERYQGRSLRPVVEGRQTTLHEEIIVETLLSGVGMRGWSIIEGQYKYVLYQWGRNREQLFDLQKDGGEMLNLAVDKEFETVKNRLRSKLYQWGQRVGDKKLTRNLKPYALQK